MHPKIYFPLPPARQLCSMLMMAVLLIVGCGRSFSNTRSDGLGVEIRTLRLQLSLNLINARNQGRSAMAVVHPVSAGNINHVVVKLAEIRDRNEVPLLDERGVEVQADVPRSSLGAILNFSGLLPERRYRIRTTAYKAEGVATEAKISKDDESYLDVETHRTDLITFAEIPVALVDTEFSGSGSTGVAVSPGTIRHSGAPRVFTLSSSRPADAVPYNGVFAIAGPPSGSGFQPITSALEVGEEEASGSIVVALDGSVGTAEELDAVLFRVSFPGSLLFLRISLFGPDKAEAATLISSGGLSSADSAVQHLVQRTAFLLSQDAQGTFRTQSQQGDSLFASKGFGPALCANNR